MRSKTQPTLAVIAPRRNFPVRNSDSLAIANFDLEMLKSPAAIIGEGRPIKTNPAFRRLLKDETERHQLANHPRLRQAVSEVALVNDAMSFTFDMAGRAYRCLANPISAAGDNIFIILDDITEQAEGERNNALLYRLSLLLSNSTSGLTQKLQTAVDQILFEIPLFDCSVMLFDKLYGQLRPCAWGTTDLSSSMNGSALFRLDEGIAGLVGRTMRPVVIPDIQRDPRFIKKSSDRESLALLCVPITNEGERLGVMCLSRRPEQYFSEQDVQLCMTIANRLAATIANEHDRRTESVQTELLRSISSINDIVADNKIITLFAELLAVDQCLKLEWDSFNSSLVAKSAPNVLGKEAISMLQDLLTKPSIVRPLLSQGWYQLPDKAEFGALAGGLIFPLLIHKELASIIFARNSHWQRRYKASELAAAASIAAQLAVNLENAIFDEAVLNERKKLHQIQNTLRDGLVLYTPEMRVAMYNESARKILGIKKNILGLPWDTVMQREADRYCRYPLIRHFDPVQFLDAAVKNGKTSVGLATVPSQPPKILEITVAPVYDRNNQLSGVLAHFKNITQIHELQAKMAARVQQLTTLFKISAVSGFEIQPIVRRIMRLILELHTVSACQLLVCDDNNQPVPLESAGDSQLITRLNTKVNSKINWVIRHRQPRVFRLKGEKDELIRVLIAPLTSHADRCIGALLIADSQGHSPFSREDINLLSIAATQIASKIDTAWLLNQIEEDRNKLAAIIDQSVDGILVLDAEKKVQMWNRALERLTGLTAEEAIGQSISAIRQEVEQISIQQTKDSIELKIRHRQSGRHIWLGIVYSPIMANNQKSGYIALVRDISRQKELEQSKNEFVSTASHELRSPITAIVGYLSMLKRGDAGQLIDKQQAFLIDKAYQNSKRMVGLIEDLLLTTRMETDQIRYNLQPVSCLSVIDGILADLRFRLEEKKITVRLDRDKITDVLADQSALAQAFSNILTNAVKYTPEGGRLAISFQTEERAGKHCLVTAFKDNGVGISPNDYEKIFQKFTRIDNPLSVGAGGTGLGLYITKRIIENLGGHLWLKSQKGEGSIFYVSLPLYRSKTIKSQ